MAFLPSGICSLNTPQHRSRLFALFLFGFSQLAVLEAAPIVFQATSLRSGGCGAIVSGDNFYFDATVGATNCNGRPGPVGIYDWPTFEQSNYFNPVVFGTVSNRYAIAYGGGQATLYKDVQPPIVPYDFTGTVGVNVVLSGSVQVCLEPAGVQDRGQITPCDPAYINFGVININVAGLATFQYYNGFSGARGFDGFYGTSAAAPEPSGLGIVAGTTLLLLVMVLHKRPRNTQQQATIK